MMGYSKNRPFIKVDVTGEVDKRFDEVTSQLAEKVKKGELFINVKDYGAKGDGVTNDTQAFVDALTSGSYTLFIPEGIFLLDGLSNIPSNTTIRGTNKHKSILKLIDNPSLPLIDVSGVSGAVKENIVIENLSLKHRTDFTKIDDFKGTLLKGYYAKDITIKNVVFRDFSLNGILTSQIDGGDGITESWVIKDCDFKNATGNQTKGIFAFTESEYMLITDCRFHGVTQAIYSANSANIKIDGCSFLACGKSSVNSSVIRITGVSTANNYGKLKVIGCKINHSNCTPLLIEFPDYRNAGVQVIGNEILIVEDNYDGIKIVAAQACMVVNNQIDLAGASTGSCVLIQDNGSDVSDYNMIKNNMFKTGLLTNDSTGVNNDIAGNMTLA